MWIIALMLTVVAVSTAQRHILPARLEDLGDGETHSRTSNTATASFYTAAVLEMAPYSSGNDGHTYDDNVLEVRRQTAEAAAHGADIIVTPEYGLIDTDVLSNQTTCHRASWSLPPLDEDLAPCDDDIQWDTLPQKLSCIAKDNRIYLVANLIERHSCQHQQSNCNGRDNVELYNTNVVFDRQGRLVARYRKQHLFAIELLVLQTPRDLEPTVFDTDFGVRFGVITCFDILFERPSVELVRRGVHHIVFPTAWGDELPSLTAVQTHSGWAVGHGVTLLSANRRRLRDAGVGSGIYNTAGTGSSYIVYTSNTCDNQRSTLIVGRVTVARPSSDTQVDVQVSRKQPARVHTDQCHATGDEDHYKPMHYNLSEYSSQPLLRLEQSQRLCHGRQLCCQLERLSSDTVEPAVASTIRLMAFSGKRHTMPHWSTDVCVIVRCRTKSQGSCNQLPQQSPDTDAPAAAVKYKLCATFANDASVFASVLDAGLRLAPRWQYDMRARCITFTVTPRTYVAQMYARRFLASETTIDEYRNNVLTQYP